MTSGNPFYKGPKDPSYERVLKEAPFAGRPEDDSSKAPPEEVTEERLRNLYDGFAYQINRATALIKEVEPVAQKMWVPVDVDATAVREALRRKGENENQIPFSMYKDLIDYKLKVARRMDFALATELTGDTLTDGNKITKFLRTGGGGLSPWEEFMMGLESFAIWLLLNQLLGNFDAFDKGACCSVKDPPGTEQGPVNLQRAIAYAAMLLIMGLQEDHVIFAVNQVAPDHGLPPVDMINRARQTIEGSDFTRIVNEVIGSGDDDTILRYADNHINLHAVEYEAWMAYRDLLQMREDAKTIYIYSHQYSQEYSMLLDFSAEWQHTTPTAGTSSFPLLFSGQRRSRVVNVASESVPYVPVRMYTDQYTSHVNHLLAIDRGISGIAGVLTSGFAYDLLCCIARFLGQEDIEHLKKIRAVLEIAYGALTGGLNFHITTPGQLLDWAVSAIQQELMSFINRFFQDFLDDVMGWMNDTDSNIWDLLFNCPLIEDMLVYILQVVGRFKARLMELIQQYIGRTWDFYDGNYQGWGIVWDAKRLRTILGIINSLIDEMIACGPIDDLTPPDDGEDTPGPGEDPQIFESVPRPLKLPDAVVEKFFSNPNPITREEGQRPIPAVGTIASSSDDVSTGNFRDICRGILPDELLRAVGVTDD